MQKSITLVIRDILMVRKSEICATEGNRRTNPSEPNIKAETVFPAQPLIVEIMEGRWRIREDCLK